MLLGSLKHHVHIQQVQTLKAYSPVWTQATQIYGSFAGVFLNLVNGHVLELKLRRGLRQASFRYFRAMPHVFSLAVFPCSHRLL
jgi:hypothetical protein